MIFRIYGKNYKVNKNLALSSKKMVQQILENVREQSYAHGIEQYYVAFVVMMYVVSSSILKEVRTNRIMSIMQDADKKSDPNK